MLSDKIQAALNDQINMELGAYYTYLSMAAYFESTGLKGFSSWMYTHSQEEMTHAMKIYDYIHSRLGRVTLKTVAAPKSEWNAPLEAFEDAMHHEQTVTAAINKLVTLARDENDHATDSFLQWFVDEQVEEEELVDDAIQKLKLVGDNGPGLYMLDQELGAGPVAEEAAAE
jgi:ferritin